MKGVPFAWTLGLWREWLLVNILILIVFNVVDQRMLARDERADVAQPLLEEVLEHEPLRLERARKLLFLAGIVLVILGKGQGWGAGGGVWPFGVQEALMVLLAVVVYATTSGELRAANRFTFGPIVEVAVLFFGIFVTMTAPLLLPNARGSALGLSEPWQFYWATGILSSFLDNAPTYLSYAAAAAGQMGVSVDGPRGPPDGPGSGDRAHGALSESTPAAAWVTANGAWSSPPAFLLTVALQSTVYYVHNE